VGTVADGEMAAPIGGPGHAVGLGHPECRGQTQLNAISRLFRHRDPATGLQQSRHLLVGELARERCT
jgi:hypothetical protein